MDYTEISEAFLDLYYATVNKGSTVDYFLSYYMSDDLKDF
jgi:hypothetical protein